MKLCQLLLLPLLSLIVGCVTTQQQKHQEAVERRQAYVAAHPTLDTDIKWAILEGKVGVGMTPEQVIASWGRPHDINRNVGSWGVNEQWVYGYMKFYGSGARGFVSTHYLYFENGRLTSWQD